MNTDSKKIREHIEYQQFYDSWRNDTTKPGKFEEKFPYELHTGPVPFLAHETRGNKILVTESYEALYHRILRLRGQDMGTATGVVVTGQPGAGESLLRDRDLSRRLTGAFVPQEKQPSYDSCSRGCYPPARL